MSGSRARAARRAPKARAVEDRLLACQPAVCYVDDVEGLAEMQRVTHDEVIARTGTRRRSGVRWLTWTGAAALAQWDRYVADSVATEPEARANQAVYRDYLLAAGGRGCLVMAVVDVAVPRAFHGPS